jgi:hypothetical protein
MLSFAIGMWLRGHVLSYDQGWCPSCSQVAGSTEEQVFRGTSGLQMRSHVELAGEEYVLKLASTNMDVPGTNAYATERGHLEVLQDLRAHGCPWNAGACTFAARFGSLHVTQWVERVSYQCGGGERLIRYC